MTPGPVALTAYAADSLSSAASTAVYAAQLIDDVGVREAPGHLGGAGDVEVVAIGDVRLNSPRSGAPR